MQSEAITSFPRQMRPIRIDSEITAFNSAFGSNLLVPDDCAMRFDSPICDGDGESNELLGDIQNKKMFS